jgi:hypothetical protein
LRHYYYQQINHEGPCHSDFSPLLCFTGITSASPVLCASIMERTGATQILAYFEQQLFA